MHRTRHANCAIKSSTANYANSNKKCSTVQSQSENHPAINIGAKDGMAFKTDVGITNVHQLISTQKMVRPKNKNNKKRTSSTAEVVTAPETALTPPSTPSSPLGNDEKAEFLANSWNNFMTNENGEPDDQIVVFKPKKAIPADFKPFDIDRFLAEKLLKELDIDPKIANF